MVYPIKYECIEVNANLNIPLAGLWLIDYP